MNNLVANFPHILEMARTGGVPVTKQRGIIREYLQVKFLGYLFSKPKAKKLSFIGGTCLRLLRGLDRFSEDLDFDNLGLGREELSRLVRQVAAEFGRENMSVELMAKIKEGMTYYELRFPELLFDLGMTTNPREKLMIKVDYSNQWKGQMTEVVLLSRYGLIEQIVTNPLSQVLVQKLAAYVNRHQTQPRDMYDIVWLYARGVRLDREFMKVNQLGDLPEKARDKFSREGVKETFSGRLRPFMFDEKEVEKIKLLGEVLKQL